MSTTRKLRLGPLPKTESIKLAFVCQAGLKADLDRYAALHAQVYGESVDAVTLIPHMLEAFLAGTGDSRKGIHQNLCHRSNSNEKQHLCRQNHSQKHPRTRSLRCAFAFCGSVSCIGDI